MARYEYKDGDAERFWSKVDKSGDCWEWTASKFRNGYGQFGLCVKNVRRSVVAHRVAFELSNGFLPEDKQVDHRCFNRACVNPCHMRLTTNKQNNEHKRNLRSDNTSGIVGVRWLASRNKWVATVQHNGKPIHVGVFIEKEEANKAVIAKRVELFTHNDADRAIAA